MKKVVRLSENDLNRLVKRIIKETHWTDDLPDDDFHNDIRMKAHAEENKKRLDDEKFAKMPTEKEVGQILVLARNFCAQLKDSGRPEGFVGNVGCETLSNIIEKYPRFQGHRF